MRKVSPFFTIYDRKSKSIGTWRLEEKLDLLGLFDRIKGMQPLFSKNYPYLSKVLGEERKNYFIKKYESEFQNDFLMSSKALGDIQSYAETSFKLQLKSIFNHMAKWGPFLNGYVLFKEEVMSFVLPQEKSSVDQIKLGNATFLRLRQNLERKTFLKGEWRETLLSLNSPNSTVFILNWGGEYSPKKSLSDFYKDFFIPARWYFDYKDLFAFPLRIENMRTTFIFIGVIISYITAKPVVAIKAIRVK